LMSMPVKKAEQPLLPERHEGGGGKGEVGGGD